MHSHSFSGARGLTFGLNFQLLVYVSSEGSGEIAHFHQQLLSGITQVDSDLKHKASRLFKDL